MYCSEFPNLPDSRQRVKWRDGYWPTGANYRIRLERESLEGEQEITSDRDLTWFWSSDWPSALRPRHSPLPPFFHPPRCCPPSKMLRKSLLRLPRRPQRSFHSSAVASRVVATSPVKAQEASVRLNNISSLSLRSPLSSLLLVCTRTRKICNL